MSRKKRPNKVQAPAAPVMPVLHGDCFRTFLDEARSIGSEVMARREYDADVVEYLKQKGLFEEWGRWRETKRGPAT